LPALPSRTCVRHFISVSIELHSALRESSSTSPVDGRTTYIVSGTAGNLGSGSTHLVLMDNHVLKRLSDICAGVRPMHVLYKKGRAQLSNTVELPLSLVVNSRCRRMASSFHSGCWISRPFGSLCTQSPL
jgi:hypothetical protein